MINLYEKIIFSENINNLIDNAEGTEATSDTLKTFLIISLSTILSLMIIFAILTLLLYNPVKKNVEQRQSLIDNNIKSAEEMNTQSLSTSKKIDAKYKAVKDETKILMDNSKIEANELKKQIINQANTKAGKIVHQAKGDIEKEKEAFKIAAEVEIISLSSQIAEKILAKEISKSDNDKMINEFLEHIKNES